MRKVTLVLRCDFDDVVVVVAVVLVVVDVVFSAGVGVFVAPSSAASVAATFSLPSWYMSEVSK